MMKFSTLAVAVFASTALFSVTSAAGSGGVRGSIDDQTQARRSLDAVCMAKNCRNGCWMPNAFGQGADKCQTTNFFNPDVPLTEENCDSLINNSYMRLADRWCGDEDIDYDDSEGQSLSTNGAAANGGQVVEPLK